MAACDDAHSIEDLRQLARRRLPQGVFDFFDGGAEEEVTLRANRAAFQQVRLRPRVLVDVRDPLLATTVAGAPAAAPFVIAPTGAIGAGWPHADIAVARAAQRAGVPYTLSTMATSTIEQVAQAVSAAPARLWFQLYVLRDHAFARTLVDRAARAGYEALVVTVDLPVGGKRERDLRNRFTVPLRPGWRTLRDFAARPGWCWQMLRHGPPRFENVAGFGGGNDAGLSIAAKVGRNLDPSFDWTGLQRLRDGWRGRFIVKGVARADDAQRLARMGVDAIWISNHGGRQLDGAVSSIEALQEIAPAVAGRVPLIVDSGVRRGVDALKARALGAQAVALGRATLWGVAAAGEAGSQRALDILREELRAAMQLCGVARIDDVDGSLLRADGAAPAAAFAPPSQAMPRTQVTA